MAEQLFRFDGQIYRLPEGTKPDAARKKIQEYQAKQAQPERDPLSVSPETKPHPMGRNPEQQLADNEFEQEVVNWLGPMAAPHVSAEDAVVKNVHPDFEKGLLGSYGYGTILHRALNKMPVFSGRELALVPPDSAVAYVSSEGQSSITSSTPEDAQIAMMADTFEHEFMHLVAQRANLKEMAGNDTESNRIRGNDHEAKTRAFLAWRAPDEKRFERAFSRYMGWRLRNRPDGMTQAEMRQVVEREFRDGGRWDKLFSKMEGRLMEEQESPVPPDKTPQEFALEQRSKRARFQEGVLNKYKEGTQRMKK